MTQNNNLSVLPFYTDIEQQNHRKSYAFGEIYPLFTPANILLPFQIMRPNRSEATKGNRMPVSTYDVGYLNSFGAWVQDNEEVGVTEIYVPGVTSVYLENIPRPIAIMAIAYGNDNSVLQIFNPPFENDVYNGIWTLPSGTQMIRVQTYSYGKSGEIFEVVIKPKNIEKCILVSMHDNSMQDLTTQIMEAGLQIVSFEKLGYDVIVYPANFPMATNMLDGRYYLVMGDGVQTWYSDVFTIVNDVSPYLKIEWWDVENFVFDAGQIVYQDPAFKNRLYFCTELGKPEYQFEEEGDNRDGYYFPTKQISEKTYKCTVLAPEYLCDVMRFIRMADYVRITDKYGREYNVDTFLLTPKWQTQGDLASVEIEFETNTVAKKIGRGYTMQIMGGDFNADFNNDFDNQ